MKATDLRIGNLVYYNEPDGPREILNKIDGTDIQQMQDDEEYLNLHSPIPLTEKWMKDFGFEIKGDEDDIYEKNDISGGLYKVFHQYEFQLTWYELSPCKYVHQLQNLYFALTGEELEISKLT